MSVLKQFDHLKIQLEAVASATNNFAEECCIGRGGFGKVYKGELLHSKGSTVVALKRLDRTFGQGDSEFWKEIVMLSVYRHQNIVSLLGFCDDKGEKILVYDYASRKSLDLHLDSIELTWVQRLKICIGAARGLAYLHDPGESQQRLLHRDIKSSNILLDENWNARIADFGLSKFGPANQKYTFLVTNSPVGTFGYCDPLYFESGILTKESDIYSFGVVLFEVLCGTLCFVNKGSFTQLARKHYRQNSLKEIIWGNIRDEIQFTSLKAFSTIAYHCLKSDDEKRPSMEDIVRALETALQYQLSTASVSTSSYLQDSLNQSMANYSLEDDGNTNDIPTREIDHDEIGKRLNKMASVPDDLEHVRPHDRYRWLETRGVGDQRIIMKRHICVNLVKRVPLFRNLNERLVDDICLRLKPRLYTNNSYIIREGDPVDEMLFIIRGQLESATTDRFFVNGFLNERDFCGDELLIWAFDAEFYAKLPPSTRTLKALRDVEAFALPADELKFVVVHFKGINRRQVQGTLRYYSMRWRTWAACFIKAAWRTYHNAGGGGRTSYSLSNQKMRLMKLGKFSYSKFTDDTDYKLVPSGSGFYPQDYRTWAACVIQASWRTYSKKNVLLRRPYNSRAVRYVRFQINDL